MGLGNTERQQRDRHRRKDQQPRVHYRRPQRRRDAVRTLVDLQAEYQEWLDGLPDCLRQSPAAERLAAICDYDFGDLEGPGAAARRDCKRRAFVSSPN